MNHQLILKLNAFAAKAAQRAELVAAAIVIGIVFMLVLPMPTWLLDALIAVNLGASGLIVVVSMYMRGPTAFSTFPAVLLLTTLFRLAISVSTTRLIMLEADAGHIVETFGNFVVGGNIGHMSAFMAQAGRLVVRGDAGEALGDSIYEARIYVRGEVASLGADCVAKPMRPEHHAELAKLLSSAGFDDDTAGYTRYGSARNLYHFHVDNTSEY